MADISMCSGKDCPLKDSCYRYTAEPSEYRQAYFASSPYSFISKKCLMYWKIKDEK